MTSALSRQVGGGHYVLQTIQPVEFAMVNGLDPCAFSILKYVSRHRFKNGLQDIEKALHFRELRHDLLDQARRGWRYRIAEAMDYLGLAPGWRLHESPDAMQMIVRPWLITPETYCNENEITGTDRLVIVDLGRWLEGNYDASTDVLHGLKNLAASYTFVEKAQ